MKISEILKEKSEGVSFEFFPPKTEKGLEKLSEKAKDLAEYKPLYASMTCGAGGTTQVRTKDAVQTLLKDKNLTVMPHLTCIGIKKDLVNHLLDEYAEQGIANIMALRGDIPEAGLDSDGLAHDFKYARDLVTLIKKHSNFDIGVAVYPEGHIETSSLEEDLEYTKKKIDSGANFAVTQMFFDNDYYSKLLERMQAKGITIPVLPGILPLTNLQKVREFASICRATIPEAVEKKIEPFCDSPEDMEKAGIEVTIAQCRDLKRRGFKKMHFFTLNRVSVMKQILDAI
tara:strand:+ start:1450 stop:2307 length:858 start_codon:yes stop_codon:yes gene_type:complete